MSQSRNRGGSYEEKDPCYQILKGCATFFCCPCFTLYYGFKVIWDACLGKCIDATMKLIDKAMEAICKVIEAIFNTIFKYVFIVCAIIGRFLEQVLRSLCKIISQCCMAIWKVFKPCLVPLYEAFMACVHFLWKQFTMCMNWIFKKIVKPIVKGICLLVKLVYDAAVEFGKLFKKYFLDPCGQCLKWFYGTFIKPVLKFLDLIFLKPLKYLFGMFAAVMARIWDFFDDLILEICYDGHEYRERKREKDERKLKQRRKIEMAKHQSQKFNRTNSTKQIPKEYIDFFGGNPDVASQFMSEQSPVKQQQSRGNVAVNRYLYNQQVIQPKNPYYQQNVNQAAVLKMPVGQNGAKDGRYGDEENSFKCPNCLRKVPLTDIETHTNYCARI